LRLATEVAASNAVQWLIGLQREAGLPELILQGIEIAASERRH